MSRLMDIARNFQFDGSKGHPAVDGSGDKSDIRDKSPADPYQKLAVACLAKICRPDYPAGMVPWVRDAHPSLYAELMTNLPDEIHRLWVEGAPLDEFERILNIWLEAHRTGCELYVKSKGTARR
jgi:hypothetical protein